MILIKSDVNKYKTLFLVVARSSWVFPFLFIVLDSVCWLVKR